MVVAAARVLNARAAEACMIDAEDSWKTYGDEYLEDAHAALEAAGANGLLAALKAMHAEFGRTYLPGSSAAVDAALAAIAQAEGQPQ
jgi:phosphoglucomutase